jgi:hypothetical protein
LALHDQLAERHRSRAEDGSKKGDPVEHWIGVMTGLVKLASVSLGRLQTSRWRVWG